MNSNSSNIKFEENAEKPKKQIYVLKLFVAGMSQKSMRTIDSVSEFVEENLLDCCKFEVIDIYQNPELARQEQIIATPTLIKQYPLPVRRKIGKMASKERIITDLNLFFK